MTDLEATYAALTNALGSDKELRIELLPEDQLLISKNLVPNPEIGTYKSPRVVPASNGYTIYIKHALTAATPRPQQRMSDLVQPVTWDAATMTLRLDRDSPDQRWELLTRGGVRFSIAVHCGSVGVFDEVDRILGVIGRVLPL